MICERLSIILGHRKEFFNVSLEDIEKYISETGTNAEFTRLSEATEYRETLAIIQQMNSKECKKIIEQEIAE